MSAKIQRTRSDYYDILERSQRGPLDITPWMEWFLHCLNGAIDAAQSTLGSVTAKARFWENLNPASLNDRQRKGLNILLDGLEPTLSSSQWAKLTHTSPDSALRDINDLVDRRILTRTPRGGRSTTYQLKSF
jgi:Fic family protein